MFQQKTPTDEGWYFIRCEDDGDFMVYLHTEPEPRQLDVFFNDYRREFRVASYTENEDGTWEPRDDSLSPWGIWDGPWAGPDCWIGPLPSPFEFAGNQIAQFSEDMHRQAREKKMAAVMVHIDYDGCSHGGLRQTMVGLLPEEEANTVTAKVFDLERLERRRPTGVTNAPFRVVR